MTLMRTRNFLVMALLAVSAGTASAAPIELKDLTQDGLRARVKAFLASPAASSRLSPLASQVLLKEDQLHYAAVNGIPQKLEWRYQTLPAFNKAKEAEVQTQIKELLTFVLSKYEGGLLGERDAQFVLTRTTFVGVPAPASSAPPTAKSPPAAGPGPKVAPKQPAPAYGAPMMRAHGYHVGPGYAVPQPAGYWYFGPTWYTNPYGGWTMAYQWRFVAYPWQTPMPQYWWQYPWYASGWYGYPWWTYSGMTPSYGYRGY